MTETRKEEDEGGGGGGGGGAMGHGCVYLRPKMSWPPSVLEAILEVLASESLGGHLGGLGSGAARGRVCWGHLRPSWRGVGGWVVGEGQIDLTRSPGRR